MSTDEVKVPEPPLRVLATVMYTGLKPPVKSPLFWWRWNVGDESFINDEDVFPMAVRPHRLTVIPHPKNDEAAVRIIEQARK